MFAYLRYFSTISLVLVLVAAVLSGMYYRSMVANDIIKNLAEENNTVFSKGFVNLIWNKHFAPGAVESLPDPSVLNSSESFIHLKEDLTKYLSGFQ